jgi:Cu2+-containing amine oxidase
MIDDSAPPLADQHPLRPLTAEEIEKAAALVRSAPQFEPPIRFVYVSPLEPPKAEVLATGPRRDQPGGSRRC